MTATIHVCTSCKDPDPARRAAGEGGGPALLAAMQAWAAEVAGVQVLPAGCLGPCGAGGRACLSDTARWTWLIEGVAEPEQVVGLQDFARLWLGAPGGLVPKAKRPPALAGCLVGRLPPLATGDRA